MGEKSRKPNKKTKAERHDRGSNHGKQQQEEEAEIFARMHQQKCCETVLNDLLRQATRRSPTISCRQAHCCRRLTTEIDEDQQTKIAFLLGVSIVDFEIMDKAVVSFLTSPATLRNEKAAQELLWVNATNHLIEYEQFEEVLFLNHVLALTHWKLGKQANHTFDVHAYMKNGCSPRESEELRVLPHGTNTEYGCVKYCAKQDYCACLKNLKRRIRLEPQLVRCSCCRQKF